MKILFVLLVSIVGIYSAEYTFEPILRQENVLAANGQYKFGFDSQSQNVEQFRNSDGIVRGSYSYLDDTGQVQFMEYTAGPDGYNVYKANLPVTVASVTETPEVKAARKAHEESYNYLQSIAPIQNRDSPRLRSSFENIQYDSKFVSTTTAPFFRHFDSETTNSPLVHNYPLKNNYETLEVVTKPITSGGSLKSYNSLAYPTKTTHQSTAINAPSFASRNYFKPSEARVVDPVQTQAVKVTPGEHLNALKNAIAAQLSTYKDAPSEVSQDHVSNESKYQPAYRTEINSPVNVKHYSQFIGQQTESDVGKNRKLAVLAATRALMKLLNN